MASGIFLSDAVRNARLDAIETTVGVTPYLRLYDGTAPADETTALSGNTLLAEGQLPSDWMTAAASGTKGKNGTWTLTGQTGAGAGTDATFGRLYASDGTTCHGQFTAGETADSPDIVLDNKNIADGQTVNVTQFDLTDAN